MRSFIQRKLNELTNITCGNFVPDDIIEENQTYFGYTLQSNFVNRDYKKNNISRINLIGYVVRKNNSQEDTLSIIDEAVKDIVNKLEELNFKCSYNDVTITDLRKVQITAEVTYNEINNEFV